MYEAKLLSKTKKNLPVYLAIIIATGVTYIFLYNRTLFNNNATANEGVLEAWGTIMGAIFTALTVYLLYRQNKQQIEDRKAASKPDLYPAEAKFRTQDDARPELGIFNYEGEALVIPSFDRMDKNGQRAEWKTGIDLHNIGLGVAKEISVQWKYDATALQNQIKGTYFSVNGDGAIVNPAYTEPKNELDFIEAHEYGEINLPIYYIRSCGIALNFEGLEYYLAENDEIEKKQKRPLILIVQYKDLYDKLSIKKFNVHIDHLLNHITLKFHCIR